MDKWREVANDAHPGGDGGGMSRAPTELRCKRALHAAAAGKDVRSRYTVCRLATEDLRQQVSTAHLTFALCMRLSYTYSVSRYFWT